MLELNLKLNYNKNINFTVKVIKFHQFRQISCLNVNIKNKMSYLILSSRLPLILSLGEASWNLRMPTAFDLRRLRKVLEKKKIKAGFLLLFLYKQKFLSLYKMGFFDHFVLMYHESKNNVYYKNKRSNHDFIQQNVSSRVEAMQSLTKGGLSNFALFDDQDLDFLNFLPTQNISLLSAINLNSLYCTVNFNKVSREGLSFFKNKLLKV